MTLLIERLDPAPTAADAAARLSGLPWLVWLDSAADPTHLGRWSFLSADPWMMLRAHGPRTGDAHGGQR